MNRCHTIRATMYNAIGRNHCRRLAILDDDGEMNVYCMDCVIRTVVQWAFV